MSNFCESLIAMVATIVSGVLVFIIGQILTSVWLMPLKHYKMLKAKIAGSLIYYANVYSNTLNNNKGHAEPLECQVDASKCFRDLACEVAGLAEIMARIHFGIPKKEKLYIVKNELIGLSNSVMHSTEYSIKMNEERVKKIYDNLSIK